MWRTRLFAPLLLLTSAVVWARPEFAVRYGINRCTACHYSPAGGGPRNQYGKYFGAFGYKSSSWADQAFAGGELKALYYRPEHTSKVNDGLGLMNGDVWASVPLKKNLRFVAEQNLGGFGPGPRQWYMRWRFADDNTTRWLPQYVLVGRLIPAFGLMTDEHRTYVRLQSGTAWNTDFETGTMIAANPTESLHYDLAVVNGRLNQGQTMSQGMADTWGAIMNWRWLSPRYPFALGTSESWFSAGHQTNASTAFSFYGLLALNRLTKNEIPATVSLEFVQAQNWNDSLTSEFVSDADYGSLVAKTTSQGAYVLVDYWVSEHFSLQYKFDQLVLNRDYPADAYTRHGLGFKYYFGANMWLLLRYELAHAGSPSESGGMKTGALSDVFGVLSVSI